MLLAVAAVLVVVWIIVESRSAAPLIDMKMMRLPAVWTTNLVAFLFGVTMYGVFAFLPEFVQTPSSNGYGFGASVTQSGLILLPASVFMFAVGIFSGRLSARFGAKTVLLTGAVITIFTFVLLTWAHASIWLILISMVIEGLGFGLAFAAMANLIVAAVPPQQTGVASGMNANIRTIGGAIGAAVMSSIVTSQLRGDGLPKESGYTYGFLMLLGASLLAAAAAVVVPNVRRTPVPTDPEHAPHPELAMTAGGTILGDESE